MSSFHDVLFPIDIALRSSGGPERKTDILTFSSGREQRNTRWLHSRRRYDAGYGIKTLNELYKVIAFFEERRGMLYAFRWRDRFDFKSCSLSQQPQANDQMLGVGDNVTTNYQLQKLYGGTFASYQRIIKTPVRQSVLISINNNLATENQDYSIDYSSGLVSFAHPPAQGAQLSAGFLFDVPVRFDTDYLELNKAGFDAGIIPKIPIVEVMA
jgi:uncharacterized protein (TIGR02217 family)